MSEQTELASIHAERTILGGILLENEAFYEASQELRTDEFYLDSHRRIYACICRLMNRGSAADIATVPEELRATLELDTVGGLRRAVPSSPRSALDDRAGYAATHQGRV